MDTAPQDIRSILATDCGSTTTKAILIEKRAGGYRLIVRGEAPTTVEAPFEDVTRGVLNAVREVEELAGRRMLDGDRIITPQQGEEGVDLYVSTSSAGGGLQMMVSGLVLQMTGESAQRAALGAGAIVMDVIALNDGRRPYQKIRRLRQLRPDMILLSGGTDGGDVRRVAEMAEILKAADPKARLGAGYELPVIYAGNKDAADIVRDLLTAHTALLVVPNLRPTLERENLKPARDAIHELFMEHVMAHAPGYKKLMTWGVVKGYLFGTAGGQHFIPQCHRPGLAGLAILRSAGLQHPVKFRGTSHPDGAVGFFVLFHKLRKAVPHAAFRRGQGCRIGCLRQLDEEFNIKMIVAIGLAGVNAHLFAHRGGGCAVAPDTVCRRPMTDHIAVKLRQRTALNGKI